MGYQHRQKKAATFRNPNRVPLEDEEQEALVAWMGSEFPQTLFWHTPNGGARSQRQGAALKRQGTQKGICDLFFVDSHIGKSLPAHLEPLAENLRIVFGELRGAMSRSDYSDLLYSLGLCPIFGIELKRRRPKGGLESDGMQEKWIEDLSGHNIDVAVCHGAEEAKRLLRRRLSRG